VNVDDRCLAANPPEGGFAHAYRRATHMPHILIIDDKSCDGWIWAGALRGAGFRISIAADNEDGWYTVESGRHALLIMSQGENALKDFDLVRKMRAFPLLTPCILIFEKQTPAFEDMAKLLEPDLRLRKPVTIPRLLASVRELLGAKEKTPAGVGYHWEDAHSAG
jgi:two-component system OmpR family response regulator